MPNYKWHYANYQHPALVAAFDMSTRTPGGLMKNLVQRTGATYDATINGALVLANPLIKAKKTKCMDFDGATNYLSLANPVSGLTCTIIGWVNIDDTNTMVYSRAVTGNAYIWFGWPVGLTTSALQYFMTTALPVRSKINMMTSKTMMFACVTNNGSGYIYIDGKNVTEPGSANVIPADANAYIGQFWNNTYRFNGRLDNMLFYNVALTPDQINSIYRSANPRM